jgi:protoporphyrinogen oxidase
MRAKMKVGIIGGGLSGISLQYYLNHPSEVLEKTANIGGLCQTFNKDGFYYDVGGHILFSKEKKIMQIINNILSPNICLHKRNNKILFKDKYIKYPFENGLNLLDKEDILDCLLEFVENKYKSYSNFEEWIYYTFGKGISDRYLIPYNNKIWKTKLSDINTEWIDRVPKPSIEDVLKSAIGINTEGNTHQLNFGYPIFGGIQSLVKAYHKPKAEIKTNFNIESIRYKNKTWIVSNSKDKLEFDKLLITAPLKEILPIIENVPQNIIEACNKLQYNSVRIVMIGISNTSLMDKSAVYIPDPNILAHRICFMGYFSKSNVPDGKSSLIAEITAPINSELYKISDDNLIERVVNNLDKISIFNKKDIVTTDTILNKYGYVIPDKNYRENINKIRKYTDSLNIKLLGRFGEHEYLNMDQIISRSKKLAEELNCE